MKTWFTADPHFGHARIIELCNRPFASVEAMNEALVERWNDRVQDDDMVFILGDLALGKLDDSLTYVTMLRGLKVLVPGNHDRVWSGHPKPGRPIREVDVKRYEAAGIMILSGGEPVTHHRDDGQKWHLCHFPDVGDSHDEDRFDAWRPPAPFKPDVIVHGHVHQKWVVNGPRINVGVDMWDYAPVSEDEVAKLAQAAWTR